MKHRRYIVFLFFAWSTVRAWGDPTNTSLMVYRVGDGLAALSSASTAVFLEKRDFNGSLLEIIAMPTSARKPPQTHALTAGGLATSEGLLTRSTDGQYIVLGGYGVAPGSPNVTASSASTIPRVVGIVKYDGTIDTTTALSDWANASNPRSVASTDGANLWMGGGAGYVRYALPGATNSVQLSSNVSNIRAVAIYKDQLYASTGSGTSLRLATVGNGLPTQGGGGTMVNLPGFPTTPTGSSPYQFVLLDVAANVAGVDTLYVADDGSGTSGIQKYSLVGSTWVLNGIIQDGTQYRGLTGFIDGGTVRLYATTTLPSANSLVQVLDTGGYNSGTNHVIVTVIATALPNTVFRGVAIAPVPTNSPSGYDLYTQQITDAAQRDAQNDPDGDGYANLLEYATGGNPAKVDAVSRLGAMCSNSIFSVLFSRNTNSVDATLIVERCSSLLPATVWSGIATNRIGTWTGPALVSETGPTSPVNVTVRDTGSNSPTGFLRLRVTLP